MYDHQILPSKIFHDERGSLQKIFWAECGTPINFVNINEVFVTTSNKGSVRGLHFQIPPNAVNKMVTVIQGSVLEFIVDLRVGSNDYGVLKQIELDSSDPNKASGIFIPAGFAHGYQALEESTKVLYLMDGEFSQLCDSGINFNSFDINWPIKQTILSSRDQGLVNLKNFESPFSYE
jgi:dTDP-4-dehydrorhamnose 3,5-epimerase